MFGFLNVSISGMSLGCVWHWLLCRGEQHWSGHQLISHITDDKPWQLTNPLSKYVKFSEVCHALFIRKMHFNDQSINFSWHHNFIDLLMMRCIKQGLFVTLQVYGGFFLDIFLPYQKIWSRSHQLTQPVLLIHKLFLFLQYFLVVNYCSIIQWGRKWSRNNRIRNSLYVLYLRVIVVMIKKHFKKYNDHFANRSLTDHLVRRSM